MKKIKVLLLILFICFLTGCSATYNLNIGDELVTEETIITMNSNEYKEYLSSNNNKYVNMYVDDENNLGSDGVTLPIDGVKYYDFSSDSSSNIVSYKGTFSYDEYRRSTIKTLGFKKVVFTNNSSNLILSSSTGYTFPYDELDQITINITSNYDIISNDADYINGNTLTWVITKSNASSKSISVVYDISDEEDITSEPDIDEEEPDKQEQTKVEEEQTLSTATITIIIFLIIVILLIVFIILKNKFEKNNKI